MAIENFLKALEIEDGNDATIMYNLANSYNMTGQVEKAMEFYDKSIKVDPNYIQSYYNKGVALEKNNRFEEAIEAYTGAL